VGPSLTWSANIPVISLSAIVNLSQTKPTSFCLQLTIAGLCVRIWDYSRPNQWHLGSVEPVEESDR